MSAVHNSEPYCKRCNTMFEDRTCFYSHVKKCKSMYGSANNSPLKSTVTSIVTSTVVSETSSPPIEKPPINPEDLKPGLHCPYCYKTFCSKFSTERHMRIMHPEKVFCKFCLETFQDISEYPDHLLACNERPKRDGKLQKLKKEIAKKLNSYVGKPITTPHKPKVVANSNTFRQTQIEYESYSNEKDYGYSEFYSSSSNIDMEASSTSYSLEMSNSYSHDATWEVEQHSSNIKSEWEQNIPHRSSSPQQQQQNLAMLEFMPSAGNEPAFDYMHHDTVQHTEDNKVYHML